MRRGDALDYIDVTESDEVRALRERHELASSFADHKTVVHRDPSRAVSRNFLG
ncbi:MULTISPECIES: hypothetical protein [unclassified Nonomuraea]|uniref:hypothetical protein n=1 Tax=unclassified Nonomuraea TaxID=2593643 RepID=UPI001377E9A9|nr:MULTISPECIES: hypothetical protein [unclassified Nonomuraea]NBE95163.1 hypothetical protein [Nonomuraea sp. K271]